MGYCGTPDVYRTQNDIRALHPEAPTASEALSRRRNALAGARAGVALEAVWGAPGFALGTPPVSVSGMTWDRKREHSFL